MYSYVWPVAAAMLIHEGIGEECLVYVLIALVCFILYSSAYIYSSLRLYAPVC